MDLTKITTPFGLLDAETQTELRHAPGIIEYYRGPNWTATGSPAWDAATVYRVRAQPPKPREWWIACTGSLLEIYETRTGAENSCRAPKVIHVREVLE